MARTTAGATTCSCDKRRSKRIDAIVHVSAPPQALLGAILDPEVLLCAFSESYACCGHMSPTLEVLLTSSAVPARLRDTTFSSLWRRSGGAAKYRAQSCSVIRGPAPCRRSSSSELAEWMLPLAMRLQRCCCQGGMTPARLIFSGKCHGDSAIGHMAGR